MNMLGPKDLPYAVTGERCFIRVDPPKKRSIGGLEIPAQAQVRSFSGELLDAGLQARDKLRDHGYKLGDHVIFGKFAGVVEEWDHVIEGDPSLPDDAYEWAFLSHEAGEAMKYQCRKTGAVRAIEAAVVLNCDDLLASIELADRRRLGLVEYVSAPTTDGRVQHVIEERKEGVTNGHA